GDGHSSQDANINQKETPSEGSGDASPGPQSGAEDFSTGSGSETETILHKLRAELEEEKKKNQRICAELAEEMEKNQRVLSLLEKEKQKNEEERKDREAQLQNVQTQLSQVQTQCLELQQYKEEKEKLNREVLELKKRLQEEEDSERRFSEEVEEQKRQISLIKQVSGMDVSLYCILPRVMCLPAFTIFCTFKKKKKNSINSLSPSQVTEREHERMVSALNAKHSEEISQLRTEVILELRESMEAAHQAELQQAQLLHKLHLLEALRLSLSTVHLSQLEHSQVNLQQEQESALIKVQASMRETFAQESALLQARHQSQLKQQNQEQQERLREVHQRDMVKLQHISCLRAPHTHSLVFKRFFLLKIEFVPTLWTFQSLGPEMYKCSNLIFKIISIVVNQVLHLQEEKTLLRKSSEEEVGQLWTQLESMRTSRQELGELKEQLLARSSRVDDIECLKKEFNEQKREIKEQNEAELENLRRYFEKRLRATEESHKEEIALLQLRLVESALEESVLKTTDDKYVITLLLFIIWVMKCHFTVRLIQEMLDILRLQLEEKHTMDLSDLQSSLTLSFKEELQQVRSDLTDHYYEELQEMKTRHAMDLEQLRAKLSDSHLRGLKQEFAVELAHLEEALKQEREHVQESMKRLREELQEKHETEIAALKSHLDKEMQDKTYFEKALHEEKDKSKSLQAALDNNESKNFFERLIIRSSYPQHILVRQWLEYEESAAELKNKLEAELEHERATLLTKHSQEMDTLDAKHKAQLESLGASHRDQLAAMAVELESKHNAELVALEAALSSKRKEDLEGLEAVLQETSQAQLEALEAELSRRHQEERDQLEKRMLGNMDTLEATYLKEVQVRKHKHREDLNCQNSEHKELMERHTAEQLSIREDLRKELAQVHMEKFRAMATELSHVHKVRSKDGWLADIPIQLINQIAILVIQGFCRALKSINSHYVGFVKIKVLIDSAFVSFCKLFQLRAEVGCLQGELEGKRAEMETLDTLLQRRERESQEGGNLLKMLTDDLQTAKEEKRNLHNANEKLKKVLIEMLRSIIATEELIGQKLSARTKTSEPTAHQRSSVGNKDAQESGLDTETSTIITINFFLWIYIVISRLIIVGLFTFLQLEQTHNVHLSLEEKFSQGREDSAQLLEQHKLLLEQLDQEAKMKSQLQLELHKAEGLLEGYVAEKAVLEESLQQKETQEERLVEELEDLKLKLQQMQSLTTELDTLLGETERLNQDRLDLQRQAEKSHKSLSMRLRTLERELEEQETKGLETELHHKTHTEDLNQRVQALEKQLKHDRQFIEEQAVEREHERDEFQQEILLLSKTMSPLSLQVESLQAIIKDKTEDHASLLAANQQAQRDLTERNEEIDKLTGRIRELEQALLNSAESNGSVSHLEQELHRAKLREQELTQDKQALEQQQLSNRLQISALQSKLDETRHGYHDNMHDPTQELRNALDTILCQENVSALTIIKEEKEGCSEVEETEEETFTSALLQEKNQEIDHLNSEIQKLEQELENARDNKALEVELEDLHSQVEHLQSEITRVRQDKQEEEERLHEVISTLQAELATLGPNLHEVSDSQDGDSINPSPAPSPEPHHYAIQEEERRGGPNSLKHELSLTHSTSSRSLRSRLKALQSQLETAVAEKEGLERLLLTQEEGYRGQGEEFGKRLKAEREKCDELKGFLILKEVELEEVKAQAEEERKSSKRSESDRDSLKVKDEEANALLEEKAHLNSLVLELQKNEEERAGNLEALKTKEQEMKIEMEVLRETSLTLERQVQEVRAEVLDMEELVAVQVSTEQQRSEVMCLKGQVEQEKVACSNLRRELQIEQSRTESRLAEIHSKLADSYRKLDEERDRGSRQVDELSRRHEADAARDRKFISDLRSQLEQERRQGEELAAVTDKLRAELLQSRRKWEDEDRTRREELQREQEAATRHRVAVETLKEQKQEASRALEVERERSRRQGMELTELKERLRLLKDKEREREEQWERERRKGRQEHMERERRHERTKSKLMASTSSSNLLETLLKENSELTQRVTSLSQERATFKHRLTCLERQLRTTENELAKVTSETENRPINDLQRLYERYLRAESFRKALVYQKRYLLLLIGGFQECEQATLCLIAHMGARPSPPLSSQRRPFGRFRAVVRVVIAVSRMKFLTRKWQKAIRRLSLSGTVNGHAPGPKAEVLRQQQQPRSNPSSPQTRDSHAVHRETVSSLVPPSKSPFRLHNRSYSSTTLASVHSAGTSLDPERSLTEYIHHLEKVQQRLAGARQGE
uniref:ELK domain-containing protein n=1 Tax=Amphiprion percula TaxID=161767 RepID=A0A3P8T8V7_AMPPE